MTPSTSPATCPECGAPWQDGATCDDYFGQLLVWEHEHPETHYAVHNLLVLCFHLQHPSRYSPEGLGYAKTLLVDFLVRGVSTQEVRRQNRDQVDSGKRSWKVTARPGAQGAYAHPVHWPMTAANVIASGVEAYPDTVRTWAQTIYEALQESGNL